MATGKRGSQGALKRNRAKTASARRTKGGKSPSPKATRRAAKRQATPRAARSRSGTITARGPAGAKRAGAKGITARKAVKRTTRKPSAPRKSAGRKTATAKRKTARKAFGQTATSRRSPAKRFRAASRRTTARTPRPKTTAPKAKIAAPAQTKALEQKILKLEADLLAAREAKEMSRQRLREAQQRLEQLEGEQEAPFAQGSPLVPHPPDLLLDPQVECSDTDTGTQQDLHSDDQEDFGQPEEFPEDTPSLPSRPCESDLSYEEYDDNDGFLSPMPGLAERRRELDRERADRELELGEEEFWWVCPKCGEHLVEHEFDNIKVERCESCGIVSIDKGEIALLLLAGDDDHIISYRIKGLLH